MVYRLYSMILRGGSTFRLSPLDRQTAKTGGTISGGQSPIILPLTTPAGFAIPPKIFYRKTLEWFTFTASSTG